jgi:dipeptidyl aminopeptidase/acylaminoacyl peptidase
MAQQDAPAATLSDRPATPFHDLSAYMALPRLTGLAVSPDGGRLVTAVAGPSADGKKYVTAIWEIDTRGERAARRLTRSAPGEAQPAFLPNGDLLFTSCRPDPEAKPDDDRDDVAALWLLPAGGEAREVSRHPGGIEELVVAHDSGDLLFRSPVLPGAVSAGEDEQRRKARKDAGVTAILHERHPVRFWDHDLGPFESHVFAAGGVPAEEGRIAEPRDLTPDPQGRVDEGLAVTADGRNVAVVWQADDGPAGRRSTVTVIDAATGERSRVVEHPEAGFDHPAFAPDGRAVVCARENLGDWDEAPDRTLWHVDLGTGAERDLLPGSPLWPHAPVFSADGAAVFFVADEQGHAPVFRLDLADGSITRLTASGSHCDLAVARDRSAIYALRAAVDEAPTPVRIDPVAADQEPTRLPGPAGAHRLPGRLVEVETSADDGVPLRAWLTLPAEASADSPAPLLLWIHGGPLASWNSWSWRWNPWLMVARGYAVLLPDPALSTGYGHDFIRRGWGTWGQRPFTDLMSVTDAACAREDIDLDRTAAMGGSFGGYMANWVATQTDRFRAIVTHASLWDLDQFAGTTDTPSYWRREFGDPLEKQERYLTNSPHLRAADIRTPMLVIHGDKDYRVPIGEALRLWYDLCRFEVPAKFLYFPEEDHWVLTPGHARVWYETVFAFLAERVLDQPWKRPDLL